MKKKLIFMAVAAACLMGVSACGSSGEVKQASSVDANVDQAENANDTATEAQDAGSESSANVTLAETELYNANGITVTATGIDTNSMWGDEIDFTITNNSGQDVIVTTRDLVVNGYSLDTSSLYAEVAAGKSATDELTLYSSELNECGISTVATVEFNIHIEDSNTWDDIAASDRITLNTSAADGFAQPVDDSGDVIYDANGIRVVCKGLKDDSIWDGDLVLFAENNTDRSVSVYSDNVSVNGYMEDASFWVDLYPYTRAVDGMVLYGMDDLQLESMDDVNEIEFNLRIVDENTWEDIDTSDPITLHFNS